MQMVDLDEVTGSARCGSGFGGAADPHRGSHADSRRGQWPTSFPDCAGLAARFHLVAARFRRAVADGNHHAAPASAPAKSPMGMLFHAVPAALLVFLLFLVLCWDVIAQFAPIRSPMNRIFIPQRIMAI